MFKPSYLVKGFSGHPLQTDATIGAYKAEQEVAEGS
jgi:hypothetical protein